MKSGGGPAGLIRKRFPDEIIEQLLKTRWWDWDEEKIKQYAEFFDDVEQFLQKVGNGDR